MEKSRRHFLALAGLAPIAALGIGSAARAADACYDPATLPLSQKNRRRALNYQEVSGDAKKHCSLCAYFTGTAAGCGSCQMLSGGAVTAGSVCDSFAPKAK